MVLFGSRRIWAVPGVIGDVLDALLDPDLLLVQLVLPQRQIVQLGFQLHQLVCNLPGVAAWSHAP